MDIKPGVMILIDRFDGAFFAPYLCLIRHSTVQPPSLGDLNSWNNATNLKAVSRASNGTMGISLLDPTTMEPVSGRVHAVDICVSAYHGVFAWCWHQFVSDIVIKVMAGRAWIVAAQSNPGVENSNQVHARRLQQVSEASQDLTYTFFNTVEGIERDQDETLDTIRAPQCARADSDTGTCTSIPA